MRAVFENFATFLVAYMTHRMKAEAGVISHQFRFNTFAIYHGFSIRLRMSPKNPRPSGNKSGNKTASSSVLLKQSGI